MYKNKNLFKKIYNIINVEFFKLIKQLIINQICSDLID